MDQDELPQFEGGFPPEPSGSPASSAPAPSTPRSVNGGKPLSTQHIVNVSGGKDSTAVYLLALEKGVPFKAVTADTGHENSHTYDAIRRLPQLTGGPEVQVVRADFSADMARKRRFIAEKWPDSLVAGKPGRWQWIGDDPAPEQRPTIIMPVYGGITMKVPDGDGYWKWRIGRAPIPRDEAQEIADRAVRLLQPTGNVYLDLCMMKGRFPSRMSQFCTEELKTVPITLQVVAPALGRHRRGEAGAPLQWLGIRAEESAKRANDPRFNRTYNGGHMLWRPILRWTLDDVWAIHRRHGVPRNPLYDMGFSRVGCFPCVNCRKEEVRLIADLFPNHIDIVREWEQLVAYCSKRGISTFFAALTDPTDVDTPEEYSGIDKIVDWSRTGRGGRQYQMFFDNQAGGGCTNALAVCE